jgi:hypothetical protein
MEETAMLVSSHKQAVLEFVDSFRLGSRRSPRESDLRALDALIERLAADSPTPAFRNLFQQIPGFWECVFTTSRFVLDLDKLPGLTLSGVYQSVAIDADLRSGHYFNIAELTRGGKVKSVCGEFAAIRPSQVDPVRIDVEYQWIYFAMRMILEYEGPRAVAAGLESNRLRRRMRIPFHRSGWQSILYLDDELRVVRGNQGGLFVLVRQHR